jgi:hypothetical protein
MRTIGQSLWIKKKVIVKAVVATTIVQVVEVVHA